METIKFIYMNKNYSINLTQNNIKIINLLNNISSIINKDLKKLYFIYKGKCLSFNNTKKLYELNDKKVIIFVFNLTVEKINNKNQDLKNIICPKYQNLSVLNNNNGFFSLNNCINKHRYTDFTINSFIINQYFDELNIECDKCKK